MASHDSSCVLWLQFDEASGDTVYDQSGNNNNGTIYGATFIDSPFNKALSFDGVDDCIEIPHSETIRLIRHFTISVWIKPKMAEIETIIAKGIGANTNYYMGLMQDTEMYVVFYVCDARGYIHGLIPSNMSVECDKWHHVVGVYDGSKFQVFVNGVGSDVAYWSGKIKDNTLSLLIGVQTGDDWFNGIIDEVRIYNRALSELEILQIYHDYIKHKRI